MASKGFDNGPSMPAGSQQNQAQAMQTGPQNHSRQSLRNILSKKPDLGFASVGKSSHFSNLQKSKEKRAAGQKGKGVSLGGGVHAPSDNTMFLLPASHNNLPGKSQDRSMAVQNQNNRAAVNFQSAAPPKQSRTKLNEAKTRTGQQQLINQSHNASEISQRTQFIVSNMPSTDHLDLVHENKNSINAINIQKNFITNKRDSRDSAIITTQSLGAAAPQSQRLHRPQEHHSYDLKQGIEADGINKRKMAGQNSSIPMQLIHKPASISIQHPQQFGNPAGAVVNPNRLSHEDAKKSLLIEQLTAGLSGQLSRKPSEELRPSTENFQVKQRTPAQQNQSGQLNFHGNQMTNFQAQPAHNMPMQLNNMLAQYMAKREVPLRNDALVASNFSQRVSHQKHVSLSPVRSNGQVARDVVAAANSTTNNGGASCRQRLMTEHSNPRDSSQDQINSIRDFAVSQGMVGQQTANAIGLGKKLKAGNQKKPAIIPGSAHVSSTYQLNSNQDAFAPGNALRSSTNSFKGYQQLYQKNQMKLEQMFQQNVSQLQKANAKLNHKGATGTEKHKKTKSTGPTLGPQARNAAGALLRQMSTKQSKKGDNPQRKSARSTSNNNLQTSQQGIQQSQLAPDQGKVYHSKHLAESVDGNGQAMARLTQRVAANVTSGPRHTSSRSNKNIQKFQTHFPSSFNSNAKGMQYYVETHGQSGASIGVSNGSNSALDKLERQTANFGQPLAERSSRLKAMNANHKADNMTNRGGPKTSKVKFANGAPIAGGTANQQQLKHQPNASMKGRVKTEQSQNKLSGGGALPHQRQLSSENLLKYKEQVKTHKYHSVIKRPVQRQAQSHKISPKSRDGQITIPMMSEDNSSRTNQTNQAQAMQVKGRTPNSNALMHVPTQSTPAQSSREAGYLSSQVRVPTTSSMLQPHDIDQHVVVVGNTKQSSQMAAPKPNQAKTHPVEALTIQSTSSKRAKTGAQQQAENDPGSRVEDLIADLQEIKLPQQQSSARPHQTPYTGPDTGKERKQLINNFFKESRGTEGQAELQEVSGEDLPREKEQKKEGQSTQQKMIYQILQNYHNLDAQAQNYILKLFAQKTKEDPSQEDGQLQNYFDVSLNQSGSATTYKQSELIQEQQFDSHKKQKNDEAAKDSPLKKRSQAKQVDFMNKGQKSTNPTAVRKHRSRQNQSDPVSPQGKNTEDLLAKDLVETVQSDGKEDRQNTIVVDLGVINKSIKDMDKLTESSRADRRQQQTHQRNSKMEGASNRPGSANSDDLVRVQPGSSRGGRLESLHQRLQSANDINQSKGLLDKSKDATMEHEALERFYIPKNVVTKYAFATRVGYIPMNPNKVNQDTYILGPCIEGPENNSKHMFGVNDGHGQFGHHVSGYIKEALLDIVKGMLDKDKTSHLKDQSVLEKEYEDLLQSAFLKCDQRLCDISEKSKEQDSEIDPFDLRLSGSTVCTVFFDGTSVHCANVGDSRAIKVRLKYDENDKLETVCEALSEDHKPDLEAEKMRILGMGGRIDTFHDTSNNNEPIGPYRVWLKHEELPGLAMSRSLGDKIAHSVGVSSLPEVTSTYLGVDDKFIVIGSDGVWEFLSNEAVAEIVLPFYQMNQPEAAANAIVKEAYKKWREQEEVVDDITTVVIFVEPYMAYRQIDLESKLEKNIKKAARNPFVQKSNSQPNIASQLTTK